MEYNWSDTLLSALRRRLGIDRVIESETNKKKQKEEEEKMPCLNISTNVSLDGVDTSSILSEATSSVAKIIGKPENVFSLSPLDLNLIHPRLGI